MDQRTVLPLKHDGHEVLSVGTLAAGASDDSVLELANELDAVLVTEDKDFGDLIFARGRRTLGVILMRPSGLGPQARGEVLRSVVREQPSDLLHSLVVITSTGIRIRRMSN